MKKKEFFIERPKSYQNMKTQITTGASQSDEIDLVDLIRILWGKKWWIVLSTFVCTTLAGIYAFTAKEQWTSATEVVGARTGDYDEYFKIREQYQRIAGGKMDVTNLSNSLFEKFSFFLYSLDEREKFFSKSDYYKEMAKDKDHQLARKILTELITEDISITKPDPKKDPDQIGTKITFSATNPEFAQNLLKQYLSYINKTAFALEIQHFLMYFDQKILDLKYEKEKIEKELKTQRSIQLANLNKAFHTAKLADIKEYARIDTINNINNAQIALTDTKVPLSDSKLSDSAYLFMLGEKYLKAQIDAVTATEIIYPPKYYHINSLLNELEPIYQSIKNIEANSFRYLSSPDYPIKRDWPKRGILLIIGSFLGLILGIILIILNRTVSLLR